MFSDHTLAGRVQNLREYYLTLYALQEKNHNTEYMLVHNEIKEKLKDCNSYTELGVNQGTTLCTAIFENIKKIRAYDHDLTPYNYAKELFDKWTKDGDIDYKIFQSDTLKCILEKTDMLFIDTCHYYKHLIQELKLHANKVNKYIICHDTNYRNCELKKALVEYIKNGEWKIITECKKDVGFITIERI